ncbi:hypothetical protein BN3661_00341 [Eubacteriaceae bacterium CHKCI005]|uniref:Uncharacterized protein n=1 Tax=Solibaculum mannosilyticum TaxID=2780922 RepID=A0A7I8D237_9FIRM|nr:hypothetical protein [Solibaculum mannosilyticum]BCI59489.1 hypothetical protein C12CBH8_01280 [Solibaculum mannosilyticum]CZT55270.1 hypothetical protein BN3661_00341 [Eubacteriaceae bacterium CHKCI005]
MIRGVNKQIVEVSETENDYFERAILFVRPGAMDSPEPELRKQAKALLQSMGKAKGKSRRTRSFRAKGMARLGVAAGMGATLALLAARLFAF